MTFIAPNPSQLVGAMSPYQLALAFNSGAVFYITNATDAKTAGLVRIPPVQGRARVRVSTNGSYGAGESSVISLRYMRTGENPGLVLASGLFTLNATTVPSALTLESVEFDIDIKAGEVYEIQRAYTAGGTPDNPAISVSVQIF